MSIITGRTAVDNEKVVLLILTQFFDSSENLCLGTIRLKAAANTTTTNSVYILVQLMPRLILFAEGVELVVEGFKLLLGPTPEN